MGPADYCVERRSQLMGQRAQELVLSSACDFRFFAGCALAIEQAFPLLLSALAFGDIAQVKTDAVFARIGMHFEPLIDNLGCPFKVRCLALLHYLAILHVEIGVNCLRVFFPKDLPNQILSWPAKNSVFGRSVDVGETPIAI